METLVSSPNPRVTIITPVYNEEESLPFYRDEVGRVLLDHPDFDFEILFVDDGSSDKSWTLIQQYCDDDPRFRALRLSRNFGAHAALGAGIDRAAGDAVAILACDLQDPPSVILEFLSKWREGNQIVWGKRRSRKDAGWRVLASRAFATVIRKHAMPKGSRFTTGSFFLMDQRVAECCRQFPERNRITFALVAYTGFEQTVVEYDRIERTSGASKWSFAQLVSALYDTFIGFSNLPARIMARLGLAVFAAAMLFSLYLLVNWFMGDTLPGWTTVMLGLSLFAAGQFLMMGLVGEYLSRIYTEVAGRPNYFVSDRAGAVGDEVSFVRRQREHGSIRDDV